MMEKFSLESISKGVAAKDAAAGVSERKTVQEPVSDTTKVPVKQPVTAAEKLHAVSAMERLQKHPADIPGEKTATSRKEFPKDTIQEAVSGENPVVEIIDEKPSGLDAAGNARMPARRPSTAKVKERAKRAKKTSEGSDGNGTMAVHYVLKTALDFAKSQFPDASRGGDAITAYLYVKSGGAFDVPDAIKELAESYKEQDVLPNLYDRLSAIETKIQLLLATQLELEHIGAFSLFDAIGFRKKNPAKISDVDLLENGVMEFIKEIRKQVKKMQKNMEIQDGRPIR